jgi:hypothetical protein
MNDEIKEAYELGFEAGFNSCSQPVRYPPRPIAWLDYLHKVCGQDLTEEQINQLLLWDVSAETARLAWPRL